MSAPQGPWVLAPAASLPSFRKRLAMFTGHLSSIIQLAWQLASSLLTLKPSVAKWTHSMYFRHQPSHTSLSPTSQEALLSPEGEGGRRKRFWKYKHRKRRTFEPGEGNAEMVMWCLPARKLWPQLKTGLHINSGHVRLFSNKNSNFKFLQLLEREKNEHICLQFKRYLKKSCTWKLKALFLK